MQNRTDWPQGTWNAYVAAGIDRKDRASRLEEVPISMRENARRHVETIFAIRRYHRDNR